MLLSKGALSLSLEMDGLLGWHSTVVSNSHSLQDLLLPQIHRCSHLSNDKLVSQPDTPSWCAIHLCLILTSAAAEETKVGAVE